MGKARRRSGGGRAAARRRAARRRALLRAICAAVMCACAAYIALWLWERAETERDNAAYSALYPAASAATSAEVPAPTSTEAPAQTEAPAPTASLAPTPTETPAPTSTASPAPTETPAPTEAAFPARAAFDVALDATRAPLATPDAQTQVYALETAPAPQSSFDELLALNPETVGFLQIDGVVSLPVVQRVNDNEFYLDHSFELEESDAGTLFLDGANLLVPEDANLIVYGHNMRNGTMFHALSAYSELDFLRAHALARFDTLYENRVYVPFAALSITAEPGSERYLNIRQFGLEGEALERYIEALRALSIFDIPIDVDAQDRILLLVTCEYVHDDGRFVLALRSLRPDEDGAQLRALVQRAREK